jgi:hypothetical protein
MSQISPGEVNPRIVDLNIKFSTGPDGYTVCADTGAFGMGFDTPETMPLTIQEQLLASFPLKKVFDPEVPLPPKPSAFMQALRQLQSGHPDRNAVAAVGSGLYNGLPVIARELFQHVWGWVSSPFDPDSLDRLLRIRLHFDAAAPELALLPWEYLKVGDTFLNERKSISLIRYPEATDPVGKLGTVGPLKILIWTANPQGTAALKFAQEIATIEDKLKATVRAQVDTVRSGSPEDLRNKLKEGYHVLHYIGHGQFDGEGKLAFEVTPGAEPTWVTADQLKVALLENHQLQLVFLNSCETATGSATSAYASLGCNLARYAPSVIAMQYPILNDSAIEFARAFYQAVSNSRPLEACVTEGRQALIAQFSARQMDWGIPALFSRAASAPLLLPVFEPAVASSLAFVSSVCETALPAGLVAVQPHEDDIDYLRGVDLTYCDYAERFVPPMVSYRQVLAPGSFTLQLKSVCEMTDTLVGKARLLVLGRPGMGKTNLIQYLAQEYNTKGQGKLLPVVVSLSTWKDPPNAPRTLLQFVKDFLVAPTGDDYPPGEILAAHLDEYLGNRDQQKRLLFFLDDYNRMPSDDPGDYQRRLSEIKAFAGKYLWAMIVVVSRSLDYDGGLDGCRPKFQVFDLNPWNRDQIAAYLDHNARALKTYVAVPRFLNLADIPYQLAQIIAIEQLKKISPTDLFDSVSALMQAFIDHLFDYSENRGRGDRSLRDRVETILTKLAVALHQHGKAGAYVDRNEALAYLGADGATPDADRLFQMANDAIILNLVNDDQQTRAGWQQVGFERQQLEDYFRSLGSDGSSDAIQAALLMDQKGLLNANANATV